MPPATATAVVPAPSVDPAGAAAGASLGSVLPLVFGADARALAEALAALADTGQHAAFRTLVRQGLLQPGRTTLWYQRLINLWDDAGRPALKPNVVSRRAVVLSDYTFDNVAPAARAFAAAQGVDLAIEVAAYDSVERETLDRGSSLYRDPPDLAVIVLSERWLCRHVGDDWLVAHADLDRAIGALRAMADALLTGGPAQVVLATVPPGDVVCPGGFVHAADRLGRHAAIARFNLAVHAMQNERLLVLDQAAAVHAAGGQAAFSAANYHRAKMPYEAAAATQMARETAATVAALCGRSHRALVTDLDNTLWRGVIGDDGPHGIVSSQDDPEGLGYYRLQGAMRSLKSLGVLLAVASKNTPGVEQVFVDNPDVALALDDFAALEIGWHPKSRSIANLARALGFGPEYMVFVDDNLFELAETLGRHPDLDVVLARPDPVDTRRHLADARLFHGVAVTDADLARHERIVAEQASAQFEQTFDDYDDYLRAIHVRVTAAGLSESNRRRVAQLLQKSNQFNLTTRRHTGADLDRLVAAGATVGVFSYEDDFGRQGVIAAVVLVPERDGDVPTMRVDTWVMSCRVLNRTVEHAIARWIVAAADGRPVHGDYIATDKNALVRDLYERLGFRPQGGASAGHDRWIFDERAGDVAPASRAELIGAEPSPTSEPPRREEPAP